MRRLIFLPFFLLLASAGMAQELHFVQFKSKDTTVYASPSHFLTERSLQRRARQGIALNERDYPVNAQYWQSVAQTGAKVRYASRWLNAVLVEATPAQMESIKALPFVSNQSAWPNAGGTRINEAAPDGAQELPYGSSLGQAQMLGITDMHADGLFGQNMLVAVLDAGFYRADQLPVFDSLRLKGTFDFVEGNASVFEDDSHGTKVLSVMAGYAPESLIGAAFRADYLLFRTEDVASEMPVEEVYWLIAAERADSLGADLINSSLGYIDFDSTRYSHEKAIFDGGQTIIARAADFAASVGMLVVASAGNEGSNSWNYLSSPADADSILTVGGVDRNGAYWVVSSPGPSADGQIKPDIATLGSQVAIANVSGGFGFGSGTSYASPLACALAAGVWSGHPQLSNMDLLDAIRKSGSNYETPNNKIGYGIPSYTRIKSILATTGLDEEAGALSAIDIFPNPVEKGVFLLSMPGMLMGKRLHISIIAADGRLVVQEDLLVDALTHRMSVHGLAAGHYLIRLQDSHYRKTLSLMVGP